MSFILLALLAANLAAIEVKGGADVNFFLTVQRFPVSLKALDESELPYFNNRIPSLTSGNRDSTGIAMFDQKGVLYNHPVLQAQTSLDLYYGYLVSGDQIFLDLAQSHLDRILTTRVEADESWFFPYPMPFNLHGYTNAVLNPPWYSAMAQGQVLSALLRIGTATGNSNYLNAAHHTFKSFQHLRRSNQPWVVFKDSEGYLWFEEYASSNPDFTYNGHIFAMFGIYDYWLATGSTDAVALFESGLATVAHYFHKIRNPGDISFYCLAHPVKSDKYHIHHTNILLHLYSMTEDLAFAQMADALFEDFPEFRYPAEVVFSEGGTYEAYKFRARDGFIYNTKVAQIEEGAKFQTSSQRTIVNRSGRWLLLSEGPLDNYWVLESYPQVYSLGKLPQTLDYNPPRQITSDDWPLTVFKIFNNGEVISSDVVYPTEGQNFEVASKSILNGRVHVLLSGGALDGFWVPIKEGLKFQNAPVTLDIFTRGTYQNPGFLEISGAAMGDFAIEASTDLTYWTNLTRVVKFEPSVSITTPLVPGTTQAFFRLKFP